MVDDPLGGEPMAVIATGFTPDKTGPTMPVVTSPAGILQGPRSYDGPDIPAGTPAPAQPRRRPPVRRPAPRPSPSSTAAPASARRSRSRRSRRRARASRPAPARNLPPRRHPADRAGRRPAGRCLRPRGEAAAGQEGRAAGRDRASAGSASAPTSPQQAIEKLPGPVTFAFAPYGTEVDRTVTRARAEGHEVLLQVPMEPFDYPDNDPGPQTLLTSLTHRTESRPPALADEPLPGLCRHRQLHGRALHLLRAGAGAGAEGDRQARADLRR